MPRTLRLDEASIAPRLRALISELQRDEVSVTRDVQAVYWSLRPGAEGPVAVVSGDAPAATLARLHEQALVALGEPIRIVRGKFEPLDLQAELVEDTPLPQDLLVEAGSQVGGVISGRPTFRGTLGWNFIGTDGAHYMLSNWHVLCSEVVAPSPMPRVQLTGDDATMPFIGQVVKFARMDVPETLWDLAIARYETVRGVGRYNRGVQVAYPLDIEATPDRSASYFKVGFKTGLTRGRYVGPCFKIDGYRKLPVRLIEQLLFEPLPDATGDDRILVAGGDSGAVMVNGISNRACGLIHHKLVLETGSVQAVASPLGRLRLVKQREVVVDGAPLPVMAFPANLEFDK